MNKKNKGFSLVELIVAMGVGAILSIFLAKLMDKQVKVGKTGEENTEINSFVSHISNIVSSKAGCKASFANYATPVKMNGDKIEIDGIRANSTNPTPFISKGDNISKDLILDELNISLNPAQMDYSTGRAIINLELKIKKQNPSNSYGPADLIRTISFSAKLTKFWLYYTNTSVPTTSIPGTISQCAADHGLLTSQVSVIVRDKSIDHTPLPPTPYMFMECFPTNTNQVLYINEC